MKTYSLSTIGLLFLFLPYSQAIEIEGELLENQDISAVTVLPDGRLLVAADEGSSVQLLEEKSENTFSVRSTYQLDASDESEADLEALTSIENTVYAVGSHSVVRKKAKNKYDYSENRNRILETKIEQSRYVIYRLKFDDKKETQEPEVDKTTLLPVLESDPILEPFLTIPSKENGIDIEGVAITQDKKLIFGFRGPVLRGNYTPVLIVDEKELFSSSNKDPISYEVRFVNLEGLGIRDIVSVKDGFLILAGPVSDIQINQKIYFWNGDDMIPGEGAPKGTLNLLTEINNFQNGHYLKAEGLTVLEESFEMYDAIVFFDSAFNGAPINLSIPKP